MSANVSHCFELVKEEIYFSFAILWLFFSKQKMDATKEEPDDVITYCIGEFPVA